MRILILLSVLFLGIKVEAQISLKGISLSEEYKGKTSLKTTVGDLKGILKINLLEDSRAYNLTFEPYATLSDYEFQNFKASVEANYKIQLFKKNSSQYYIFRNNITYTIDLVQDDGDKSHWDVQFSISDENLEKIKNERKELIISTDF